MKTSVHLSLVTSHKGWSKRLQSLLHYIPAMDRFANLIIPIRHGLPLIMKKQFTAPIKTAVTVAKKSMFVFALSTAFFPTLMVVQGQSVLLADIARSEELTYNEYSALTGAGGRVYFLGHNDTELWTISTSLENNEGPKLLRRFVSASKLIVVGPRLYFVANDGVSGSELWKSDGTIAGTVRVKDIIPGKIGGDPDALTNVRGTLYFSARNGINGKELWKSNGSAGGTMLVKDIVPRTGSSNPTSLTEVNGTLYFAANDGINGTELWRSDGTDTGTVMVKDIKPGVRGHSSPNNLVNVYGTLFFVAADADTGRELWKSDGTAAGTVRVKDIRPGANPSGIANTTAVYRTLFFSATDGIHGEELWKSDGTEAGTVMVKDMTPGPGGNQDDPEVFNKHPIANFTNISGTLFFTGYENDVYDIWKSNGTAQGTVRITSVRGPGIAHPKPKFTLINNRIYYFNEIGYAHHGLWSMGRNGTDHQHVMDFWQEDPYSFYYPGLALVGNLLYLSGRPDALFGFKLIRYDGTAQGTRWWDIRTTSIGSDPSSFIHFNGKLFFKAMPSSSHHELWATDGTPEGTSPFARYDEHIDHPTRIGNYLYASEGGFFGIYKTDLRTGKTEKILEDRNRAPISRMLNFNGVLAFILSNEGFSGSALWKSNGTREGTMKIMDFGGIGDPIDLLLLNDKLILRVLVGNEPEELWSSNGTASGTTRIKTWSARGGGPSAVIGNTLYLVANDGIHGKEIWKTDGTAAGTSLVRDLRTGDLELWVDDIQSLIVFRDTLYISAMDQNRDWALFKMNDKDARITKVSNIDPVENSVVFADELLLFTRVFTQSGKNNMLWSTDGTTAGTELVQDLGGAPYNTNVTHHVANSVLYFSTAEGGPLWRTDGTTCGTFVVDIGTSGAFPIGAVNARLIFGSYDEQVGQEPHAYNLANAPGNPCDNVMASETIHLEGTDDKILTGYPNPFNNEFALRINGKDGESAHLRVFTLFGSPVENIGEIKANTDRRIGQGWRPGVYVVQVARRGSTTSYMLVKE
ncbi:MAG: ELWxxDGT repeat protein [Chryseosolibacter sp.]